MVKLSTTTILGINLYKSPIILYLLHKAILYENQQSSNQSVSNNEILHFYFIVFKTGLVVQ